MQSGQVTKGKRLHGSQPRGGRRGSFGKRGPRGSEGREGNQPAQRESAAPREDERGGRAARAGPGCSILRWRSAPQPQPHRRREPSPGAPRHRGAAPTGAAPAAAFPSAAPGLSGGSPAAPRRGSGQSRPAAGAPQPGMCQAGGNLPAGGRRDTTFLPSFFFFYYYFSFPPRFSGEKEGGRGRGCSPRRREAPAEGARTGGRNK